jgi:bifunctional non-homologous end joining protein LigD
MTSRSASEVLEVDGRRIELSHTAKVLFPKQGLTKGDLIDYYRKVAPVMLPHIEGRPLSLQRYPDGIEATGFMQKNASAWFPPWIQRAHLAKEGGAVDYVLAGDAATLVYLANQAAVTLHTGLARVDRIDQPDRLVIDLDPSDDDFAKVRRAAKAARALLAAVGLVPFVQTTGSRGLHVWVPLDGRADFDEVRAFASDLAGRLAARAPDELTSAQRKAGRGKRVFLDVGRNAYGQTAVAPYSVRARPEASVATPLDWAEVDDASLGPRRFTIVNLFRRLGQKPDPWASIGQHARPLEPAARRLAALPD